jgi:RNA polymerase sigma-32 factor
MTMFDSSFARYLRDIHKFPLLTPEEEYALAKRWREHGDLDAAQRIATSHLRLVAKIAMQYRGYGRPISDLVSEGSIGMLEAVKRFDPDRGCRVATYAIWWIRAAIMDYIIQSCSLVKMGKTAAQRKLFFNLRRLKRRLQAIDEGDLLPETVTKIAAELDVSEADVVSMGQRLAAPDYSLNVPGEDAKGAGEWLTLLADDAPDQETIVAERSERRRQRRLVSGALNHLDPRERDIVLQRHFRDKPATLGELSERHAISCERIRQIEGHALKKMRQTVHLAMIPIGVGAQLFVAASDPPR